MNKNTTEMDMSIDTKEGIINIGGKSIRYTEPIQKEYKPRLQEISLETIRQFYPNIFRLLTLIKNVTYLSNNKTITILLGTNKNEICTLTASYKYKTYMISGVINEKYFQYNFQIMNFTRKEEDEKYIVSTLYIEDKDLQILERYILNSLSNTEFDTIILDNVYESEFKNDIKDLEIRIDELVKSNINWYIKELEKETLSNINIFRLYSLDGNIIYKINIQSLLKNSEFYTIYYDSRSKRIIHGCVSNVTNVKQRVSFSKDYDILTVLTRILEYKLL